MSKIKVVQIAIAASEDTYSEFYLDDKGRVWYQENVFKERNHENKNIYELKWKQLDLPEEPEL